MVEIGTKVYEAGDWLENTKIITVTEKNLDLVNMFWNKLYFDNQEEADAIMYRSKAEYGEWLTRYL